MVGIARGRLRWEVLSVFEEQQPDQGSRGRGQGNEEEKGRRPDGEARSRPCSRQDSGSDGMLGAAASWF